MKTIFRRKKPPLKQLEKGDLQHIATLKMRKAAKIAGVEPGKPPSVWRVIVNNCPLCKKPLTPENQHIVVLNHKPVAVHSNCPE